MQPESTDAICEPPVQAQSDVLSFVKDLFEFFYEAGYLVSSSMIEDFIRLTATKETIDEQTLEDVLRPLIVKNKTENATFTAVLHEFWEVRDDRSRWRDAIRLKCEDQSMRLNELQTMQGELYDAYTHANDLPACISMDEYQKRQSAGIPDGFSDLVMQVSEETRAFIDKIDAYASGQCTIPPEKREDVLHALENILKGSILMDNASALMQYTADKIRLMLQMAKESQTQKDKLKQRCEDITEEIASLNEEMDGIQKDLNATFMDDVYKYEAKHHRDFFTGGKNAVHSDYEGDIRWMENDFGHMDADEKKHMQAYIQMHQKDFRSRLTKYIKEPAKKTIDIPETCKKAFQTDGVPVRLAYKKPSNKRAKIMLILDISGSCSDATELMLTFMFYMKECIPGGCLAYVFVNSLHDVTDIFAKSNSPDQAIQNVMTSVGTAGGYSNYGRVFREFCTTEFAKINSSKTYTFFIGDARNNKNPSEESCFRTICQKSMKTCWMNTEPKEKWNTGDSIIGCYGQYVDRLEQVTTPKEMFHVLETLA